MITTYFGVVHPWHCDIMGHLTTRHYVGMFDDSHLHFFAELGVHLDAMLKRGEGFADVKSIIEYKNELRQGALVEIRSQLISLGRKSFVHRHEMYDRQSGVVAATMENVTVAFDVHTRKAVTLFENFRRTAQDYLPAD